MGQGNGVHQVRLRVPAGGRIPWIAGRGSTGHGPEADQPKKLHLAADAAAAADAGGVRSSETPA